MAGLCVGHGGAKMADDKRPSGPPGGKRRRPPATIDLKATEITPDPVQPAEPVDPPQEAAWSEPQPAAASATAEPAAEPAREAPQPPPEAKADPDGSRREGLGTAAMGDRMSAVRQR